MSRKLSKILALILAIFMFATIFAGCSSKKSSENSTPTTATAEATAEATETVNTSGEADWSTYKDSSDIPTWTGKQLKITRWDAFGTGGGKKKAAQNDVVSPELTRVTGVTLDKEKVFDNNSETADVVLAKLVAAGTLPSIAGCPDKNTIKKMVDADLIYDLTDLYPQYMTSMLAYAPKDKLPNLYDNTWVNAGEPGKIYAAPTGFQPKWLPEADSTIDLVKWTAFSTPKDPSPHFYMRDDIIKKLFPSAKSRDELEQLYVKNGKFTKDDILDIPLNSKEDFIKMLYDIKELGIKEGTKEVYPFVLNDGSHDYWGLFDCFLGGLYGWNPDGTGPDNNYYTFFNKKTQQVDYFYKQPIFKEAVLQMNKLVRDGIVPKESLIDNNEAYKAKINNGLYAITFAWYGPDETAMKAAGKNFRYRKVYTNIPQDTETFTYTKNTPEDGMGNIVIFKDSVNAEDVPQILKYYDFQISEAGQKLIYWGPKSAELFTETNGKRVFKDKDLEQACVYGVKNDKSVFYGLPLANPFGGQDELWPRPSTVPSKWAPAYTYDKQVVAAAGQDNFVLGTVDPFKFEVNGQGANFWSFSSFIPQIDKFSKAKMEHEKVLEKCFTATSDSEFEKFYQEYVTKTQQLGLSEDILPQLTKVYSENVNNGFMENLK